MKQVLLDTSFILACVKQKIDFIQQLEEEGIKIIISEQVFVEIEGLTNSKPEAKTALQILQKSHVESIHLKSKTTDKGIINFAKQNPKIIVATLDREIKKSVQNPKLIIRGKKKLEVV